MWCADLIMKCEKGISPDRKSLKEKHKRRNETLRAEIMIQGVKLELVNELKKREPNSAKVKIFMYMMNEKEKHVECECKALDKQNERKKR